MKTTERYGVRPVVTDDDYALYAQFFQRYAPDRPLSPSEFKLFDRAKPEAVKRFRTIVSAGGEDFTGMLVTEAHWQTDPGMYQIEVHTWPEMSTGLVNDLINLAESTILEAGGSKVTAWIPDRDSRQMEVLTDRGYEIVQRNPESQLKPEEFDADRFKDALASFDQTGLKVVTLADLEQLYPQDWKRMFYDAEWELSEDVPRAFERQREPFESFSAYVDYDKASHRFHRFAMEGDRIVGMTMLLRNEVNPSVFWTGLTGVSRDWRRKSVATVLKVLNIKAAMEEGAKTVSCDNEESNPMLQLNYTLGFRTVYNWCDHRKTLA